MAVTQRINEKVHSGTAKDVVGKVQTQKTTNYTELVQSGVGTNIVGKVVNAFGLQPVLYRREFYSDGKLASETRLNINLSNIDAPEKLSRFAQKAAPYLPPANANSFELYMMGRGMSLRDARLFEPQTSAVTPLDKLASFAEEMKNKNGALTYAPKIGLRVKYSYDFGKTYSKAVAGLKKY